MVILSAWLIGGAFIDGWAHTHGRVDTTFFTPWHVTFYTGFLALACGVCLIVGGPFRAAWQRRTPLETHWQQQVPLLISLTWMLSACTCMTQVAHPNRL